MMKYVAVGLLLMEFMLPGVSWSSEGETLYAKNVYTLDEIIISATKTEERRADISNSVIFKDEEDIVSSSAESLGDLLGNEQGIDLRTYGNYGGASEEIHIRGMGADGTQILVNGISVNSPSLGTADASKISLNNIERIEVVKGSGSLLYGTGAMAGTVNIITKRPDKDSVDLTVSAGYGTNNFYEVSVENGMFFTENLGYNVSADRKETDGFRSNSDLDHKDLSFSLAYDGDNGPDITFYMDYLDRDYGLPGVKTPEGTSAFTSDNIRLYDDESSNLLNRGGDEDGHFALDISGEAFDRIKYDVKGTLSDMENFNKTIYYYYGFSGSDTWVTNRINGVEGNADIDIIKGLDVLVGFEYKKFEWENRSIALDEKGEQIDGTTATAEESLDTSGLFAEAQYRPNDYLKMIAGFRREKHSEFGTQTVNRYGIVVNPDKDTAIKFNYGEHYNAPTPNDLFWPYEDWGWGMGTEGNRNLRPETGRHVDAGIEKSLMKDKLFINASYFKWDIKDKISWIPDASYFYTPQNLDTYKGEGWEIGTSIGPFLSAEISLSYTSSEATEELYGGVARQAKYTSDSYFKADINYANDLGTTVGATFRYTGDRPGYYSLDIDTEPEVLLSSYYTVDLSIGQMLFKNWMLSVRCNNLLDEGYDTYTSSFTDQTTGAYVIGRYPGAGRSLFFNVSYRY